MPFDTYLSGKNKNKPFYSRNRSVFEIRDIEMSDRKKGRRRSSLAAARIHFDLTLETGKGLHKIVDGRLPDEARLAELSKLAIKHGMDRYIDGVVSEETKDLMRTLIPDVQAIVNTAEARELIAGACNCDRLLPNPDNEEMDETIHMLEERINRLGNEEAMWKEYLEELTVATQNMERKAECPVIQSSDLSSTQRQLADAYLPSLTDLRQVAQQAEMARKQNFNNLHQHRENIHSMKQSQALLNKRMDEIHSKLLRDDSRSMSSPRHHIENLIEFPSP
ncbi:uncharacterized protein LOC127837949 [Dreissena polymorpha]|uniref:Uncharacterized protein n=1 Tax=Dreissena polymorpha TaxID=45954 RepID=A0A9D4F986_DREPO|nr:uncharacterized protein LOC127837949 [Dreissena polymorpha]KAH3794724.1 hypothetical protein DPMN_148262 [Dreissena polymorpha]